MGFVSGFLWWSFLYQRLLFSSEEPSLLATAPPKHLVANRNLANVLKRMGDVHVKLAREQRTEATARARITQVDLQ